MAMDQARRVFVVGAGASAEAGLPVGFELKSKIEKALKPLWGRGADQSDGRNERLQYGFNALLNELAVDKEKGKCINDLVRACDSIANNMQLAQSIDSYIDIRRDDELVTSCGKLALAYSILQAEKSSLFYSNEKNQTSYIPLGKLQETWYIPFFNLLTRGCTFPELQARFSRFSVITFNYDRCIEQFLHAAVMRHYEVDDVAAEDALRSLKIYHPYGYLGPLPFKGRNCESVAYGVIPDGAELLAISKRLKTFTEGVDPQSSEVCAIRNVFKGTDQVVFLGFAFNDANLDLLEFDKPPSFYPRLAGFASGRFLSASNISRIRSLLGAKLGIDPATFEIADETCYRTLLNHGKHLGLG